MQDALELKCIAEAALLAAGRPLSLDELLGLFEADEAPSKAGLREALAALETDYAGRGVELAEVGGGFRLQTAKAYAPWVARLWEEKPARYTRATLETLALIAYRQPITRGEIEEIRGVSVASNIVRSLTERGWIRVVGHRDVPGKPALFSTTKEFLNYFGLKGLSDLPPLSEIRDLDQIERELELELRPEQEADQEAGEETAGEEAGEEAGKEASEEASEEAGEEASEEAGEETAGEEANEDLAEEASEETAGREAGEEAAGRDADEEADEETAGREADEETGEETAGREADEETGEETAGREADEEAGDETAGEDLAEEASEETAGREAGEGAAGEGADQDPAEEPGPKRPE